MLRSLIKQRVLNPHQVSRKDGGWIERWADRWKDEGWMAGIGSWMERRKRHGWKDEWMDGMEWKKG